MIEDMTHLPVIHKLTEELQQNLVDYNSRANGMTEKAPLLALRIEQNKALAELLRRQLRHLRYMNGEKIEPEAHEVEAVLYPVGGMLVP